MKLKQLINTMISFLFSERKQHAAKGMMKKITELEAQNEALATTNEHLMKKLNEDTMQLSSKNKK